MELLSASVEIKIIKLIGCWCSNEILRYLNIQAKLLTRNFYQLMLTHGNYSFLPQQYTPVPLYPLPLFWPLVYGDSDTPQGSELSTNRGDQTRKWLGGGGGANVLTSK